jgi:hypothetical protein
MKKLLILLIFLLVPWLLPAPGIAVCYIESIEPVNIYNRLAEAVYTVESSRNPLAYNPKENAVGGFQIRQCKLDQYIKETGKFYTLEQMYNKKIAKYVFMHFTKGRKYEVIAREWNGRGSATIAYWKLVKAQL